MNCTATTETEHLEAPAECLVEMPLGLLGFERFKRFALVSNPADEPFLWLQVLDDPKPAFLVVSPFAVRPDYRADIPQEDARFLGLEDPSEGLLFNIVTVHGPNQATVNLKGPILMNRRTLVAKQVIPLNAAELPVSAPLPVQGN